MKKAILISSLLLATLYTMADNWCGNSYIFIGSTWYTASNSYLQTAGYFHNNQLGTFSNAANMLIGGELQVYPATEDPATLYYSFDNSTYTAIQLPKTGTEGNNSVHKGSANIPLNSLSEGTHSLYIYFKAGTVYDSNNSTNYIASFTVSSTTAIGQINSNHLIITSANKLTARFDGFAHIKIYNNNGLQITNTFCCNQFEKTLKSGVYIITINGISNKIAVN